MHPSLMDDLAGDDGGSEAVCSLGEPRGPGRKVFYHLGHRRLNRSRVYDVQVRDEFSRTNPRSGMPQAAAGTAVNIRTASPIVNCSRVRTQ